VSVGEDLTELVFPCFQVELPWLFVVVVASFLSAWEQRDGVGMGSAAPSPFLAASVRHGAFLHLEERQGKMESERGWGWSLCVPSSFE